MLKVCSFQSGIDLFSAVIDTIMNKKVEKMQNILRMTTFGLFLPTP